MSSSPPQRILLVRFSALGDVVQTLPILSMLREAFPQAKIGWAIDRELVPAIQGHPCLDYIHPCDRNRWSRELKDVSAWRRVTAEMGEFLGEIKRINYDVAVDAQGLFKTAIVPFFAGIKRRVGYAHGRELSSLFYTEKYLNLKQYFDPAVFHLDHMALLAKAIGAGEVRHTVEGPVTRPETRAKITQLLNAGLAAPQKPLLAIAPGTQWVSKHWPEEYWVALLDRVLGETDFNIALVGAKGDSPLCARIQQAFPQSAVEGRVIDVSGKTSIPEMYGFYEQVQAAIGSDSAPLHIAGAMRVPVLIGIYGPTAYRRTPPVGGEQIRLLSTEIEGKLACQPCHKKTCPLGTTECMTSIRPDQVFQTLTEALHQVKANALTERSKR